MQLCREIPYTFLKKPNFVYKKPWNFIWDVSCVVGLRRRQFLLQNAGEVFFTLTLSRRISPCEKYVQFCMANNVFTLLGAGYLALNSNSCGPVLSTVKLLRTHDIILNEKKLPKGSKHSIRTTYEKHNQSNQYRIQIHQKPCILMVLDRTEYGELLTWHR